MPFYEGDDMNEERRVTKTSPEDCEWCGDSIKNDFVDGKLKVGPWCDMCLDCHKKHGVGLGLGKGQRYQRQAGMTDFVRVEG